MSYTSEQGRSGAGSQVNTLILPPLAPKIAALAEKDPHWGQVSRLEQWRRWLGKKEEAQTEALVDAPLAKGVSQAEPAAEVVSDSLTARPVPKEPNVEAKELAAEGPTERAPTEKEARAKENEPEKREPAAKAESVESLTERPAVEALSESEVPAEEGASEVTAPTTGGVPDPEPVVEPMADTSPQAVVQPEEEASPKSVVEPPSITEPSVSEPSKDAPAAPKESGFSRIKRALSRTGQGFEQVFLGQKKIDDELLEDLETQLLTADLGMEVTTEVIDNLTESVQRKELSDVSRLQEVLKQQLVEILKPCEAPLNLNGHKPFVLLTVGVNGVGKTTTIGKLAKKCLNENYGVMLAAGDTFRAAAVEQLQTWGERNQVPVVAQHTGADSASVIFDALESAKARKTDVLIADTAGRLHTKDNLMEELKKIKRVMAKLDESAPHEVLLVLDAGTGQNAVNQLEQFHNAVGVTGIALTKLDGTAKGGVIFALCRKFGIPVRYIGVGEGVDDLQPFDAEKFVDALLTPLVSESVESATVH
jgi:fused signal recognition particle receptor